MKHTPKEKKRKKRLEYILEVNAQKLRIQLYSKPPVKRIQDNFNVIDNKVFPKGVTWTNNFYSHI